MSESNRANADIKSMKLYHHVDRVLTELRQMGKEDEGPLSVDELTPFDQLHYHGTEAVDHAVRATGVSASSSVLEIGSGLGGPARHISPQQLVHRSRHWNSRATRIYLPQTSLPAVGWQKK